MTTLKEDLLALVVSRAIIMAEETVLEIQSNIVADDIVESGALLTGVDSDKFAITPFYVQFHIVSKAKGIRGQAYSSFQDKGTGIYGPAGRKITYPGGGSFKFFWRRMGGQYTELTTVKGTPKTGFFTKGIEALDKTIMRAVWAVP